MEIDKTRNKVICIRKSIGFCAVLVVLFFSIHAGYVQKTFGKPLQQGSSKGIFPDFPRDPRPRRLTAGHFDVPVVTDSFGATKEIVRPEFSVQLGNGNIIIFGNPSKVEGVKEEYPKFIVEEYNPGMNRSKILATIPAFDSGSTLTLLDQDNILIIGKEDTRPTKEFKPYSKIFNISTATLKDAALLHQPRIGHTATKLANGNVVIAGGVRGKILDSIEIYNPKSNVVKAAGNLGAPRTSHSAELLNDGRIAFIGGAGYRHTPDGRQCEVLGIQFYNPVDHSVEEGGKLLLNRADAGTYYDKKTNTILVAGGWVFDCSKFAWDRVEWYQTRSVEVFDLKTQKSSQAGFLRCFSSPWKHKYGISTAGRDVVLAYKGVCPDPDTVKPALRELLISHYERRGRYQEPAKPNSPIIIETFDFSAQKLRLIGKSGCNIPKVFLHKADSNKFLLLDTQNKNTKEKMDCVEPSNNRNIVLFNLED